MKHIAIYKGTYFRVKLYEIYLDSKSYKRIDTIDLKVEAEKFTGDMASFDDFDVISDIRFIEGCTKLRITQLRKKVPFIFDYILIDCKISIRKGEKYEDKSIFKQGLTYISYHESLHRHIN